MKLYDSDDDQREKIQKARSEVERLAQERLQNGVNDTIQQARVAVFKARPDLTEAMWGAGPPEPEPEPEKVEKSAREVVEDEVKERASVLLDQHPDMTRAEALLRALKEDRELWRRYINT